jgi:hypothetical protein
MIEATRSLSLSGASIRMPLRDWDWAPPPLAFAHPELSCIIEFFFFHFIFSLYFIPQRRDFISSRN